MISAPPFSRLYEQPTLRAQKVVRAQRSRTFSLSGQLISSYDLSCRLSAFGIRAPENALHRIQPVFVTATPAFNDSSQLLQSPDKQLPEVLSSAFVSEVCIALLSNPGHSHRTEMECKAIVVNRH